MGNQKHKNYISQTPSIVQYDPGTVKPLGEPYTKRMVVSKTRDGDVRWIEEHFGEQDLIDWVVYCTDDVGTGLHVPK
jgi:hypothetical protein